MPIWDLTENGLNSESYLKTAESINGKALCCYNEIVNNKNNRK